MKRVLCLALLLWLRPGAADAQTQNPTPAPTAAFQGQITISEINRRATPASAAPGVSIGVQQPAPPSAPVDVRRQTDVVFSPVLEVKGEVGGLEQKDVDSYSVQLVAYRLYDGNCFMVGTSRFEPQGGAAGRGKRRWVAREVRLPLPDYDEGFDLTAVLVRRERALPDGVVDPETVRQYAVAFAQLLHGDVGCAGSIELTSIRDITGRMVSLSPDDQNVPEVGWVTEVRGTVKKPAEALLYLTVHPVISQLKWVMEYKGDQSGQYWNETGYFGEQGLHTGELFRLQAVVSRHPIPKGPYTPDQWHIIEGGLCTASSEVLVRKRSGPGDLVIRTVDEKEVAGVDDVQVGLDCQVAGSLEDPRSEYALRPSESVWVISHRVGADEGWVVGGLAILMTDGLGWRVPSLRFSQPGQYQLAAVATTGTELPRRQLNDRDWYLLASNRSLRRLSQMVTVNASVPPAPAAVLSPPEPSPSVRWLWLITGLLLLLLLVMLYVAYRQTHRGALN